MLSIADLSRSLSAATIEKGRRYQRSGRASVTVGGRDTAHIEGRVKGTRPMPYRVAVDISQRGSRGQDFALIAGHCSCPVGFNCKHVAALLLEVLADQTIGAPPSVSPLSDHVAKWLAGLESATRSGETSASSARERLIYLLSIARVSNGIPRLWISPIAARLLKDGTVSPSQIRVYDPATALGGTRPKFLLADDLVILPALQHFGMRDRGGDGSALVGIEGAELIARILATGRCQWQTLAGPILAQGPVRRGTIRWVLAADGTQHPEVEVDGGGHAAVASPPWYVDPAASVCGPLEFGLPPIVAANLLAAPPLSPSEAAIVRSRLTAGVPAELTHGGRLALPAEVVPARQVAGKPVPRLRLYHRDLQLAGYWAYGRRPDDSRTVVVPLAALSFIYSDMEIAAEDPRPRPLLLIGEGLVEVTRSTTDELAAANMLAKMDLVRMSTLERWRITADCRAHYTLPPAQGFFGHDADDSGRWFDFLLTALPALRAAGWLIEIADDFPFRIAETDGNIEAELTEGSGIDWFELHLGLSVDGVRVDLLPVLLGVMKALSADEIAALLNDDGQDEGVVQFRLDEGRVLPLPYRRVRPILRALAGLYNASSADDGRVVLRPSDAAELAAFEEEAGVAWRGGEALRALGQRLKSGVGLPDVVPPPSFAGVLRPYQQAGLGWLQLLREVGLGGILADDMGLGKTVQLLAHLAVEKASGRMDRPCLVVAPTSLMPNWRAEAEAFTPDLSVLVQHGAERKEKFDAVAGHDLILTTYALLARDVEILAALEWHMVIADEAQFVKNPATVAAKALRRLTARHRLALTGTPLENHLGELWALFDFVSPGFLGDAKNFTKQWRTPIEKRGNLERQQQLARRVRPFLLRRTKGAVATELPPKTEIIESIALGQQQRDLYDGIRLAMHTRLRAVIAAKGLKRSRIELLDALMKLRQACCDPRLVKTAGAAKAGSAKLERLMEMLPPLIDEGRRILLFSQFTSMLDLIQTELARAQIPFVLLTGETTDRATPVRRFQRGEVPLFLISLRAGGTGLNLTAADTVIHYDPWWNPAVEAQATDRAHRIGQDKPVFVHKLMVLDTIETKMGLLKERKQALADGLFDPEAKSALDISEADVEFLLGSGL